jgi:hypothetical protein
MRTYDLVANLSEFIHFLLVCSLKRCGVLEWPVQPHARAGENRASTLWLSAHGDDIPKMDFTQTLFQILGVMAAEINADFPHNFCDQGMDALGFQTRTKDFKRVPSIFSQESFRHWAPRLSFLCTRKEVSPLRFPFPSPRVSPEHRMFSRLPFNPARF